jgi:glycosyltransferase involved in cell wall biosynthesis
MKLNNLVSIIIPCYNDWQYVGQSIDSALNQTYSNIEVIVVDDGSDVRTKTVLKQFEAKITKLIIQENKGQSTARNVGIREAKGSYILVLDSDDFFEPSFCTKALSIFTDDPSVKLVSCFANLIFKDSNNAVFRPVGGNIENFLFYNAALGTSIFKKSDWSFCGGYDEDMINGMEDWEFFIRLLKDGGTTEIIQEPLYNYRKRNDSTTTIANKKKYELFKYIYLKHQELYKNNFDLFISFLLSKIEREEIEKIKNTKRLEFRIGEALLSPLRKIKSIFK